MSIRKREWINSKGIKCSSWEVDYFNYLGKRVKKAGFRTKAEAENYVANAIIEKNKGIDSNISKNIILVNECEDFIKRRCIYGIKPSTIKNYRAYLKNHIKPFFQEMKMFDVTPRIIEKFIEVKQNINHLSNKTIKNILTMIKTVFNEAMKEGKIYKNPVYTHKKLQIQEHDMLFLDKEEIKKVLSTAETHFPNFYPILLTAITTGLRQGEILALQWKDIDFEKKAITVNKTLYRNKIQAPKTKHSYRQVNMPDILCDILIKFRKNDEDIVFPNQKGNYTDPNNMVKRYFKPCLKLADVKEIRFHDLRHTFASLIIAKGADPKYIQCQMGHYSCQMSLDRYGHMMPDSSDKYRNILNDIKK